ncbi:MAG TPA: hypothetical protein QF753_16325 [Victivallales bacterium]|nr:hypothetical protein [Victivallales bacterium]
MKFFSSIKIRNNISFSNIGILFLFFLTSLLLISCCKTCFLARNEITGFSAGKNKAGEKIITINAGDIRVEFSAFAGGKILLYSVEGDNVVFDQSQNNKNCGDYSDFFLNQSGLPLSIVNSTLRTFDPDKIIITSSLNENFTLTKVMKMNLNNGDVHVLEKLSNSGTKQKTIYSKNTLNLKPGGFLIIPINFMSKFKGGFVELNNDNELMHTDRIDYFEKYNDLLLVNTNRALNTIASDSNSGWFAYIRNDVLMIIKYPYFYKRNYLHNYTVKSEFKEKIIKLLLFNPNRTVDANKALYTQFKFIIIKLDKPVKSFDQVKKALKKVSIPLMLRR